MKVLVIGKGGREHALVWKLSQSPRTPRLFCAPGNPGTAQHAENVDIEQNDIDKLLRFARKESIDLTIVGPEEPLALGIVDAFQEAKLRIFGPTQAAAQLESSKVFAKELMRFANVPTADFKICDHPKQAFNYIATRHYPMVIKADGLAAGKGVIVCNTNPEALAAVDRIMVNEEFGAKAGRQIVIEKRIEGQELSILALVSGRTIIPLEPTQDHKALYKGDNGPNTGGMGAYCPAPLATPELLDRIDSKVLVATVHAMKRRSNSFRGVLYAGIMVNNKGPCVLEFNARFGDPETQPLLMRLQTDLLDLLEATVDNRLEEFAGKILWDPRPAVCVVLTARGYPGNYERDAPIHGLDAAAKLPDVQVFHAGTRKDGDTIRTDGGRVLGVTALGDTLQQAQANAYAAVRCIHFNKMHYRTDIASKALPTEAQRAAESVPPESAAPAAGEGNNSPGEAL